MQYSNDNDLPNYYENAADYCSWINGLYSKFDPSCWCNYFLDSVKFWAYSVGGIRYVIYILIVIMIIHAIEAYILNPKFMSSKTELPIFYTFVVLLAGEHFLGTWGLIVGVPIFTFLLDILGVKSVKKKKPKILKIENKK